VALPIGEFPERGDPGNRCRIPRGARITAALREIAITARSFFASAKKNHNTMKKTLLTLACAFVTSLAFAADVETTTSTTTSTGTLTEYTPGSTFVVKESSGPVTYRYGEKVTYVTRSGKTLAEDEVRTRIKAGIPVSVGYTTEGNDRVISRVEIDDD
jgi:hypothetical protein